LVGKYEKNLLLRPRPRWKNNIRIDLRDVGYEVVNWMHLAQNADKCQALMNTIMNLHMP
jgi:hypothetical protein